MLLKNLKCFQNKGVSFEFQILEDGRPLNLVGKDGFFKVYLDIPSKNNNYIINKEAEIIDYDSSTIKITLENEDMLINTAVYNYILEIQMESGLNKVFFYGSFEVLGDDTDRLAEIKRNYGLDFEEYNLINAFNYAHSEIIKNVYEKKELEFQASRKLYKIDNFVMDSNFDGVIDKNDIEIIQYMRSPPYTVQDLSGEIDEVIFNHPIGKTLIELKDNYPSQNYVLQIKYYRGKGIYSSYKQSINRIEELYILIYLFSNLDAYKLQRGLSDRSINGVTIRYDQRGVQEAIKSFYRLLDKEINKIRPLAIQSVLIKKNYSRW